MKYFIWILFTVSIIISFFYKQVVFNNKIFKDNYNIKLDIKNDYNHFFFLKNQNPLYIFKSNAIKKYSVYTYKNNKPNLIYSNQQTIADINYIGNIQYVGNIIESFTAKFLNNELNNITDISPYWTHIYNLWQTLLPASKHYEGNVDKQLTWQNSVQLWEKWIFFNCDKKKIKNILSLPNDKYMKIAYSKSWRFYEENKNPCTDKQIPSNLWFNYFQYLKNLKKSVKYYKITWFDETALPWIIGMVWVVNGMLWEHEKAMYILIQRAISMYNIISSSKKIDEKKIKNYKDMIKNSINRAEEELHFYIIEQAENKSKICKKDYKCLVKNWYIQQEVKELKNKCMKDINLKSIKTIKDIITINTKQSLETTKCFLLWIWETNGYIINWQLQSAIIKWWKYYYDKNNQRWWVRIKKD